MNSDWKSDEMFRWSVQKVRLVIIVDSLLRGRSCQLPSNWMETHCRRSTDTGISNDSWPPNQRVCFGCKFGLQLIVLLSQHALLFSIRAVYSFKHPNKDLPHTNLAPFTPSYKKTPTMFSIKRLFLFACFVFFKPVWLCSIAKKAPDKTQTLKTRPPCYKYPLGFVLSASFMMWPFQAIQ